MKINGNNNNLPENNKSKNTNNKPPKSKTPIFTIIKGNYIERKGMDGLIYEKYTIRAGGTYADYHSYEYDENGNVIKEVFDNKGGGHDGWSTDGIPESVKTFEYDTTGKIVKETQDRKGGGPDGKSADGTPDWIKTYEYNEYGVLVKETEIFQGENPDAPPKMITTAEYDNGHNTKRTIDLRGGGPDGKSADGIPDWTRTYEPEENNS